MIVIFYNVLASNFVHHRYRYSNRLLDYERHIIRLFGPALFDRSRTKPSGRVSTVIDQNLFNESINCVCDISGISLGWQKRINHVLKESFRDKIKVIKVSNISKEFGGPLAVLTHAKKIISYFVAAYRFPSID